MQDCGMLVVYILAAGLKKQAGFFIYLAANSVLPVNGTIDADCIITVVEMT